MHPPIWVEYIVTPFYQNYPQFLESGTVSVAWPELQGKLLGPTARAKHCGASRGRKQAYPCGLAAMSYFNDSYEFHLDDKVLQVETEGLAWPSDVARFDNPRGYNEESERYSWLPDRFPGVIDPALGAKTERFVAWMRPNAMPHLSQRWARIMETLRAGQTLTVQINSSFPVAVAGGQKQLLLEEQNAASTKLVPLGRFLVVCGVVCFGMASMVLAIHRFCERRPGQKRFGRPSRSARQVEPGDETTDEDSAGDDPETGPESDSSPGSPRGHRDGSSRYSM